MNTPRLPLAETIAIVAVLSGCATNPHQHLAAAEATDALQVYRAVATDLAAKSRPDVVTIGRAFVTDRHDTCDEQRRRYLGRALSPTDPRIFDSFCGSPTTGHLSRIQRREIGASWPVRAALKSQRTELRLSFSKVAFDRAHGEAVVYVQHDHRGEYWLLVRRGTEWAVKSAILAWIA